jgi:hypothetical protein
MLRRVALVRTDVSEELSASFITVTRIGELGTTLAVTSNRRNFWFYNIVTCYGWVVRLITRRGFGLVTGFIRCKDYNCTWLQLRLD